MVFVRFIKFFLVCGALSVLPGCVGTVDQANKEITDYQNPSPNYFDYQGIIDARAISDSRLEIDFYPAGESEEYIHKLYVNESKEYIPLSLETIRMMPGGFYRYTLKGLTIDQTYSVKIAAEHMESGEISSDETVKVVKTFSNRTATFNGLKVLTPMPGNAATEAILQWNRAVLSDGLLTTPYDVAYYEVRYVSEEFGPEALNTDQAQREEVLYNGNTIGGDPTKHPTSLVVSNLAPDTTYYFQVRAIHHEYYNYYNDINSESIPFKHEQNSQYLAYKTASENTSSSFAKDSLQVSNANSNDAFTQMIFNWDQGEGAFTGYRFYIKKYSDDSGANVANINNDEVPKEALFDPLQTQFPCVKITSNEVENGTVAKDLMAYAQSATNRMIGCFDLPSTVTNFRVKGLHKFGFYQAKVSLCRDEECSPADGNAKQAILSDIAYSEASATLAPFSGIALVQGPKNVADEVVINFTPPLTERGYASRFKLYCVDPVTRDLTTKEEFPQDGSAMTSGPCEGLNVLTDSPPFGLSLDTVNTKSMVGSLTKLVLRGAITVQVDPTIKYCFAATPVMVNADTREEGEVTLPDDDLIVRCIQPEVHVPTSEEFPGLTGSCAVDQGVVTLNWNTPISGVYDQYKIFYSEDSAQFNFETAKTSAAFEKVTITNANQTTTTISGPTIVPGKTYDFGILTYDAGSGLYSEPNLSTLSCYIPLPKANFKEWTRIFAIGPKVDGRFPTVNSGPGPWPGLKTDGDYRYDSRIFEALDDEGLPYDFDAVSRKPDVPEDYKEHPGSEVGATNRMSGLFDGVPNSEIGTNSSRKGIVSIAWKHASLDFSGSLWDSEVALDSDSGYKIYRSDDNGATWKNLTGNRVIKPVFNYQYKKRATDTGWEDEDMVFFTDYSVEHLRDSYDVARARVYLYKIKAVFKGQEITYNSEDPEFINKHNVIKVTLPPPNMALVHRKMANRQLCLELNKDIDKKLHYTCQYNGIGARPRSTPWSLGTSVIDQGGDLLVDRFELGCNYSRGDMVADPSTGNSNFDAMSTYTNLGLDAGETKNRDFSGVGKSGGSFVGCHIPSYQDAPTEYFDEFANALSGVTPRRHVFGDCLGAYTNSIPAGPDLNNAADGYPISWGRAVPGAGALGNEMLEGENYIENIDAQNYPKFAFDYVNGDGDLYEGFYGYTKSLSTLAQGEFGAVFYNNRGKRARGLPIYAPHPSDPSSYTTISSGNGEIDRSCSINLASIGADGSWRSRWLPVSAMGGLDILSSTVSDLFSDSRFYNSSNFKNPGTFNDNRLPSSAHSSMTVSRIISSNNAEMPPLTGLDSEKYAEICSNYKVQVGFSSSDGSGNSQFTAVDFPQRKGLTRRKDSLMAGRHPETMTSNTEIVNKETIQCVASARPGNALALGYLLREISSDYDQSGPARGGSSQCVSKFGVHDIPGNLWEANPEQLFCDYNRNEMGMKLLHNGTGFFAFYPHDGSNDWALAEDFDLCFDKNSYEARYFWEADAELTKTEIQNKLAAELGAGYDIGSNWTYRDGNRFCFTENLRVVKEDGPNAGYCSIVDEDSMRLQTGVNFLSGSQIKPSFDPYGNLDATMITNAQEFDRGSIEDMRSGDGSYLNFGDSNLAPPLFENGSGVYSSSLYLDADNTTANFFSPVLGMPLLCGFSANYESCSTDTSDNSLVSLKSLWQSDEGAPPAEALIDDFPIGNSNGFGLNLFAEARSVYTNCASPVNGSCGTTSAEEAGERSFDSDRPMSVALELTKGSSQNSYTSASRPQELGDILYIPKWRIERGSSLRGRSSGSYNAMNGKSTSGVFSFAFGSGEVAGRCSVLINEGL